MSIYDLKYEPSPLCKSVKPPFEPVTDCEIKDRKDMVRVSANKDLVPPGAVPAAIAVDLKQVGNILSPTMNQISVMLSSGSEQESPIPLQVCAYVEIPAKEFTLRGPGGEEAIISAPGYQKKCIEVGPDEIIRINALQQKDPKWRPVKHVAGEGLRNL